MNDNLGKAAEKKIQKWLDRPKEGYCLDRIKDQMTGFYGSKNICDFTLFISPNLYYIESKATWSDRFEFSMISKYQYEKLLEKSEIDKVFGCIIILFATVKRAFVIDIKEIERLKKKGKASLNINKIDKWEIRYKEISTIQSKKELLDYNGGFYVH
jgi:penicillin-binding protein-related factor A (putative recombinase)